jgi:hypothetical protein
LTSSQSAIRGRNELMIERIERAPVEYPFSFVVAGDSGAWPDPTAEGIYVQLIRQVAALSPPPVFFVNLGDFAGPGTPARHHAYIRTMEALPIPNLCVVGNHDLDDAGGWDAFVRFHGPVNYQFAFGHTRFVAIHSEPGVVGQVDVPVDAEGARGPRAEDLVFLEAALAGAQEPYRVVLMHMPRISTATSRLTRTGASSRARTRFSRCSRSTASASSVARMGSPWTRTCETASVSSCPAAAGPASAPTTGAFAPRARHIPKTVARSSTSSRSRSRRATSRVA